MMSDGPTPIRKQGETQLETLLRDVVEDVDIERAPSGELFAVPKVGPRRAIPLRGSDGLRAKAANRHWAKYGSGASQQNLTAMIEVLAGTVVQTEPVELAVRVARLNRNGSPCVVIDLGRPAGELAVVAPGVRSVVAPGDPGYPRDVVFRQSPVSMPHPLPVDPASLGVERWAWLTILRDLLPVPDEMFDLLVHWMAAALYSGIPLSILLLEGPQGSGKTMMAKTIGMIIDPSSSPLQSPPTSVENLAVVSASRLVGVYDNLSSVPPWLSDALCRLVTGDSLTGRARYTDTEAYSQKVRGTYILTTINPGGLRPDLLDRTLRIELDAIEPSKRRPEREFDQAFEKYRGLIFGGLLDLLAAGMKEMEHSEIPKNLPRMADFAVLLHAFDKVRGTNTFHQYCEASVRTVEEAIDNDPTVESLAVLLETLPAGRFYGTVSELRTRLAEFWQGNPRDLPSASKLGHHLSQIETPLRSAGWTYVRDKSRKAGRRLTLAPPSAPPSPCRGDGGGP